MAVSPSKAEQVFAQLRSDILAGRHLPGARLRYSELSEHYGTSMGVLREGLLRLAEQGLVKGEPQLGFQVVELSAGDLLELTDARRLVETLTLGRAIDEGDVDWESRVIASHHRLSRTPQLDASDPVRLSDAWTAAHADFHNTLLDGCSNRRLKAVAAMLRDSAELYRQWSLPLGQPGRDAAVEHALIVEDVLARDRDGAMRHLCGHVDRTTEILLASAARNDELSEDAERPIESSTTS
jgi:DNA-binding GntR family transcriptional regulator